MAETIFSVTALGGFLWAVRVLLPKAIRHREPLAVICAALTALGALLLWLLIGVRVVSR